ncbi:MAG: hypothetical protein A3B44_01720 [Candidatus Levybacteria bacterium RIFCSPLOWO2_01_FULL_38_21]|nr:MAG: hypothetical protein A3B44_01720 [Candidatus Levybacteria bacterium RIFCSPLOWO2_01_FULL_38_21]
MQIIVTPKAAKDYKLLPKTEQTKIKRKLEILEENPYIGKKLSAEFSELRVLRAWPYRIIYYIDNKRGKIFIVNIHHRQGAYK